MPALLLERTMRSTMARFCLARPDTWTCKRAVPSVGTYNLIQLQATHDGASIKWHTPLVRHMPILDVHQGTRQASRQCGDIICVKRHHNCVALSTDQLMYRLDQGCCSTDEYLPDPPRLRCLHLALQHFSTGNAPGSAARSVRRAPTRLLQARCLTPHYCRHC